jgi:hypothetical protein
LTRIRTILTVFACIAGTAFVALGSCQDAPRQVPTWGQQLPGKIVYVRNAGLGPELVQVSPDGTGELVLPTPSDAVAIIQPVWTDAGESVAFTGLTKGRWSRFRVDTADDTPAVTEGADALQLVTVRGHGDDLLVETDGVFVVDPQGGPRLLVACDDSDHASRACANVRWGPDKAFVVLQRCGADDDCEIIVASREHQSSFVLATGKHPDWVW